MLFVNCSSHFAVSEACAVAPSVTMDSAAASSSVLGLVFAAALSMRVATAASLLLLLAVYDRMLVVGAAGV